MSSDIIDVTAVEVLHDRVVRLTFETGEVRDIDLAPFLWGPAFDGLVGDDEAFSEVRVDQEAGTIVWPNGADLSAHTLYRQSSPASDARPRELGSWAGRVRIADDFDEPIPQFEDMPTADPHDVRLVEELLALDPAERLAALARAAALRDRVEREP